MVKRDEENVTIVQLIYDVVPKQGEGLTADEIVSEVQWFKPGTKRKSIVDRIRIMKRDCFLVQWTADAKYTQT